MMARRWDAAVGAVIAARHPMTPEERADLVRALVGATQEGAFQGTRKEAACMICRLDHDLPVRMGLWVGGAFVASCVLTVGALAHFTGGPFRPDVEAGPMWHELVQNNPISARPWLLGKCGRTALRGDATMSAYRCGLPPHARRLSRHQRRREASDARSPHQVPSSPHPVRPVQHELLMGAQHGGRRGIVIVAIYFGLLFWRPLLDAARQAREAACKVGLFKA